MLLANSLQAQININDIVSYILVIVVVVAQWFRSLSCLQKTCPYVRWTTNKQYV